MKIVPKKESRSYAIKFVAEDNGKIMGWAYLYVMFNDIHDEPFGFLENVFVHETHRGKGVGSKLVSTAINEARTQNCYKLICTSRHESTRVHDLYIKLGFRDYGKEFRIDL